MLFCLAFSAAAFAGDFSVVLDRDTISPGESATLTLSLKGSKITTSPSVPAIPNLSISGPSTSESTSVVFDGGNSQSTHQITYVYSLTPAQPGQYVIPEMTAVIDGQTFKSQPTKLVVTQAAASAAPAVNPKTIFLRLVTPKTEVYIGEILPLEIQLYAAEQARLTDMPHFKEQGFTLGKMLQPTQGATLANNQRYDVVTYKTCVVPVKVGKIDLGPATIGLNVPRPNSRRSWPFNEPLDWQNVTVDSDPLTVQVLPLPRENAPAGFCGAVGNYSLAMTVSPTNVAMGDPVTVKVQISGRGALDTVTLPSQDGWREFKLYPPTSDFQPSDPLGFNGTKTFTLTAVPQSMEVSELPPFKFSFFDPEQKTYRTLTQAATPIIVRPSAASLPAPVLSGATGNDNQPATRDIAYIKAMPGLLAQLQTPLVQQSWFLALQGVPVLAWLSLLVVRKQKERLANNPRLRRQREVEKSVRASLKNLHQLAAANQSEPFFATLFHVLQEQLGERLDLPASAITEAVIDERLRRCGVSEENLFLLRELFQSCNQARYSRQSTHEELASMIPKLELAITELRKLDI